MNFRGARRKRAEFSIDLMPLIDVVFLLLIFFLITTSFARPKDEHAIPVNLPSGVSGAEASPEDPVTIVVAADGRVRFEDEEIEGADLQQRLQNLKSERPDAAILLRGDTDATHGQVVETLDAIKAGGFQKVNLIIKARTPYEP